jgi:hypothetical protein
MARLQLIDAGFDTLLDPPLAQKALRNGLRIELVASDALGATPGIRTIIGQIQRTVRAQFANQVQLGLKRQKQRGSVAKVAGEHQIGQREEAANAREQGADLGLDAPQLGGQLKGGFGCAGAAFGTTRLAFDAWLGGFGLRGGLLLSTAHDLLDGERKRAALFGTNEREGF